jgi:peptidase C39-like protein
MRNYARSVAAFVAVLSLTASFGLSGTSALASSGGIGSRTGVKDGGVGPSDPSPAASWTLAQSLTYANKLPGLSRVSSAFGTRLSHPYTPLGLAQATGTTTALCPTNPTRTPTTAQCAPPASKSISIYNDPEPNSYYGYQCGPAAGHNALGAYGVNYPVGTGYYPNASYLTQEMRTDSNGTVHTWMPGSLNSHESQNTYVWQTLGTPAGSTNGTTDLLNYTVDDIWYNDSPIYNIETYGFDPITGTYRYPFSQYSVDIAHYLAAYGYSSSGAYISISDSAVQGSYTGSQRYTQYYQDVWAAIHNNPNLDAILW